jgi:hypothetical protein
LLLAVVLRLVEINVDENVGTVRKQHLNCVVKLEIQQADVSHRLLKMPRASHGNGLRDGGRVSACTDQRERVPDIGIQKEQVVCHNENW